MSIALSPAARGWIYRVLAAAAPIAVAYGVVSGEQAAMWVGLVGALAGTGLAAAHTPGPAAPASTPLEPVLVREQTPVPDVAALVAEHAARILPDAVADVVAAAVRDAVDHAVPDLVDVAGRQLAAMLDAPTAPIRPLMPGGESVADLIARVTTGRR